MAPPADSAKQRVSLLAVAFKYGLTCIGSKQGTTHVHVHVWHKHWSPKVEAEQCASHYDIPLS